MIEVKKSTQIVIDGEEAEWIIALFDSYVNSKISHPFSSSYGKDICNLDIRFQLGKTCINSLESFVNKLKKAIKY